MKIKKGDKVIVISGKDKGKTGIITNAYHNESRVLIEGLNVKKRHVKARKAGQKGQVIEKSMPIHVSNVQIVDPKTGKGVRIGILNEGGKRIRVSRNTSLSFDSK